MIRRRLIAVLAAALTLASRASAQQGGAGELGELIHGLGVNTRVLVIGAHPDDEDTQLITWLARGRQVETAYLSLTRGDGGQNLIGNELGEALGAIRTEELLAARRIDGGHQYFTRAYDFGFSKSAEETYQHWPKDSILRDVVSVVRDFRPHVIVAVFSGTPRDGHGHHQVSGLLAREAFDLAGDSIRMPSTVTHGRAPWTPLAFYRSSRFGGESTYRFDVGEYSPLRGESYAEIAAESRSQHKSQAFGSLHRKGVTMDGVRLEASHIASLTPGKTAASLFDGIDTTWTRVVRETRGSSAAIDSIPTAIAAVRRAYDPFGPEKLLEPLGHVRQLITSARNARDRDAEAVLTELERRVDRAIVLAAGMGIEAVVDHETWAVEEPVRVAANVFDRSGALPLNAGVSFNGHTPAARGVRSVAPLTSGQWSDTLGADALSPDEPWWLLRPRTGDIFGTPILATPEDRMHGLAANVSGDVAGVPFTATQPVVYRFADPIKGEIQRPIALVPAISVTVDQPIQYVPANHPFERVVRVELRSASNHPRSVRVALALPRGLTADSTSQTIGLPDYAGNFGGEGEPQGIPGGRAVVGNSPVRTVEFRVSGMLPEGRHTISALAESEGR
ncbi:MAG TPA: PIG-L family deacetylase, partial [Gemmatimonadaceae bacterium]|nr:PIG-L family deacetylase [Gemmatimonadaceae bacterium]